MIYSFFSSLPFVKGMPKRVQIIFFCIAKFISVLVLSKLAFAFGYVFMDDLQRAVAQFIPSTSGGMPGASTQPTGPSGGSGSGWTYLLASGNENCPSGSSGGSIGQPDLEVEMEDELSPIERRVKKRLDFHKTDPAYIYDAEDIQVHVQLKSEVVDHMSELDPNAFWMSNRNEIISESILTNKGAEYRVETLSQKLQDLRENGVNSHFFKQLVKMRKNFQLYRSWDLVLVRLLHYSP